MLFASIGLSWLIHTCGSSLGDPCSVRSIALVFHLSHCLVVWRALPLMYKNLSVQLLVHTKPIFTKTHLHKSHIYNGSFLQCLVCTKLELTIPCLYKTHLYKTRLYKTHLYKTCLYKTHLYKN